MDTPTWGAKTIGHDSLGSLGEQNFVGAAPGGTINNMSQFHGRFTYMLYFTVSHYNLRFYLFRIVLYQQRNILHAYSY